MASDPNITRKAYVHLIFTEMMATNLLSQGEWEKTLLAWVAGEGDGVTVGSVKELGAAIWAAVMRSQAHWEVRQLLPGWAEEVRTLFDAERERQWRVTAQNLGIPGQPSKGWG